MRAMERKLERKRLDFEMRSYRRAGTTKNPTQGLLKAIRQSLHDFEASEMKRTITLKSMAKIANAMGCKVVYGIVPKGGKTLEKLAEERLWASVLGRQGIGNRE